VVVRIRVLGGTYPNTHGRWGGGVSG